MTENRIWITHFIFEQSWYKVKKSDFKVCTSLHFSKKRVCPLSCLDALNDSLPHVSDYPCQELLWEVVPDSNQHPGQLLHVSGWIWEVSEPPLHFIPDSIPLVTDISHYSDMCFKLSKCCQICSKTWQFNAWVEGLSYWWCRTNFFQLWSFLWKRNLSLIGSSDLQALFQ